jgi:hypothetical protein
VTNNDIWLEVDKSTGAIMSYFLQRPTTPSGKCDYIEATKDELIYLNALEDYVLPTGTVATLSHLEEHRIRANKEKAKTKTTINAPQKPSPCSEKAATSNQLTIKDKAKASLIAALKQHRSHK